MPWTNITNCPLSHLLSGMQPRFLMRNDQILITYFLLSISYLSQTQKNLITWNMKSNVLSLLCVEPSALARCCCWCCSTNDTKTIFFLQKYNNNYKFFCNSDNWWYHRQHQQQTPFLNGRSIMMWLVLWGSTQMMVAANSIPVWWLQNWPQQLLVHPLLTASLPLSISVYLYLPPTLYFIFLQHTYTHTCTPVRLLFRFFVCCILISSGCELNEPSYNVFQLDAFVNTTAISNLKQFPKVTQAIDSIDVSERTLLSLTQTIQNILESMLQTSSFNLTTYRATIGSPTPEKDLATFIDQMQRVALQVSCV